MALFANSYASSQTLNCMELSHTACSSVCQYHVEDLGWRHKNNLESIRQGPHHVATVSAESSNTSSNEQLLPPSLLMAETVKGHVCITSLLMSVKGHLCITSTPDGWDCERSSCITSTPDGCERSSMYHIHSWWLILGKVIYVSHPLLMAETGKGHRCITSTPDGCERSCMYHITPDSCERSSMYHIHSWWLRLRKVIDVSHPLLMTVKGHLCITSTPDGWGWERSSIKILHSFIYATKAGNLHN